jgi:RnfABCDGE-type electron transport complex D subunit
VIKSKLESLVEELYKRSEGRERVKVLVEGLDGFLFGNSAATAQAAPWLRDGLGMQRYMILPIVALLPAALASVYFFGWRAVAIILICYLTGGLVELGFSYVRKEEISEGLLVTGILFPLTLPPTIPLWMAALGMAVGVAIGKEIFGGTGHNIFNPALVGRAFLLVAFPTEMTTKWMIPLQGGKGFFTYSPPPEAITQATPLMAMKFDSIPTPWTDLFWGRVSGSLGETSAFLLILGGLFLIATKGIDWRIPFSFIATVGLLSWVIFANPLFHLLAGGVLLGAFFMATDPVTSPIFCKGRWIFGVMIGILTVLIRAFTGYVEGVMFAILIGNMFTPLIDNLTMPKGSKIK